MQNFFFIDIETVPQHKNYAALAEDKAAHKLWAKRFKYKMEKTELIDDVFNDNGLYAEFCKIVSVSVGVLVGSKFYLKTFVSKDEKWILNKLKSALQDGSTIAKTLAGHNIVEFDCPILMRRYIANGIGIPNLLNVFGMKPWELPYKDTMQMWGGTQWKYMVSLDMLCHVLNIDSSKKDISGEDVADLYYSMFDVASDELPFEKEDKVLKLIGGYNADDVIASARVYARLMGLDDIKDDQIHLIPVE